MQSFGVKIQNLRRYEKTDGFLKATQQSIQDILHRYEDSIVKSTKRVIFAQHANLSLEKAPNFLPTTTATIVHSQQQRYVTMATVVM